jgi:hypothetical protein
MATYRSNLRAPDLRPYFRLLDPPRQHCGYDAPSDPDFDPDCLFWTVDEAAILCAIAGSLPPYSEWVDIGCRLGWTAKHVNWVTNSTVLCIDPALNRFDFRARFFENMGYEWGPWVHSCTAPEFFARDSYLHDGFVIDGCHDSPEPLNDAMGAHAHAKPDCVIMLHDFMGAPVRDAVRWLMDHGWRCRVYWTPNGVACCWRGYSWIDREGKKFGTGGWLPPDHTPDPAMDFAPHKAAMVDFADYWERCE